MPIDVRHFSAVLRVVDVVVDGVGDGDGCYRSPEALGNG
jgi:hypothetical protein